MHGDTKRNNTDSPWGGHYAECVKTEPQTVLPEKEICGGNNAINFANTRLGVEQNTIIDRGSTERPELTAL